MAPEVIMKQNECTKSVDIWAVGIIMYEVLTSGLHPLCTAGDSRESYEEKIRQTKGLKPHPSFSILSRHLFQRLTELQGPNRHTALDALQHPWITRLKMNRLPVSQKENVKHLKLERSLR
jgi:calcium/calmodulin-dependent protein kinase I